MMRCELDYLTKKMESNLSPLIPHYRRRFLGLVLLAAVIFSTEILSFCGLSFAAKADETKTENAISVSMTILPPDILQRIQGLSSGEQDAFGQIISRMTLLYTWNGSAANSDFVSVVHRWESGIDLGVDLSRLSDADKSSAAVKELENLANFIKGHSGPELNQVSDLDNASFWIIFGSAGELQTSNLVDKIAEKFYSGNSDGAKQLIARLETRDCTHYFNATGSDGVTYSQAIDRGISLIRNDIDSSKQIVCLRRSMSANLGFINPAIDRSAGSWTIDSDSDAKPTDDDGEMIRLLYSGKLVSGMPAAAAFITMLYDYLGMFR